MQQFTDPHAAAAPIAAQIAAASHVLVLTHVNPDGDAIGSLLGATHVLRAMGKQVTPVAMPPLPAYTLWLPAADTIQVYTPGMALPQADLLLVVDTASMGRLGEIYPNHIDQLGQLPMLVVDHHITNDGRGTLNLIQPAAASACELLYQLFAAMDAPISPEAATCMLIGVTTDTQSFQTSATKPSSMRAAADMVERGAQLARVVHEVYFAMPPTNAALMGHALTSMRWENGVAWAFVTRAMMDATGAGDEAADEVIQVMQRLAGIRGMVLLKEREDGTTKISLRSLPPYNVAALAQHYGGGGHAQAAGATLLLAPEAAAADVLPRLRALVDA